MKRDNMSVRLRRRRESVRLAKSEGVSKSGFWNGIAIVISIAALAISGFSAYFQWSERATPYRVERFVAQLTSYREVSAATREFIYRLPDFLFWPNRHGKTSREELSSLRNMLLANAVLWDPQTAAELTRLAHSVDLVLLGLDGLSEVDAGPRISALVESDQNPGTTPQRVQLMNDIVNGVARTERLMQHELDPVRDRGF